MSYEIARSISISKTHISMCVASNNVYPKTFQTIKLERSKYTLAMLLKDLDDGNVQPTDSANGYKWWYIMKCALKGLSGDERLAKFTELATTTDKAEYVVKSENERYFQKCGQRMYLTSDISNATRFNRYQAEYFSISFRRYANTIVAA